MTPEEPSPACVLPFVVWDMDSLLPEIPFPPELYAISNAVPSGTPRRVSPHQSRPLSLRAPLPARAAELPHFLTTSSFPGTQPVHILRSAWNNQLPSSAPSRAAAQPSVLQHRGLLPRMQPLLHTDCLCSLRLTPRPWLQLDPECGVSTPVSPHHQISAARSSPARHPPLSFPVCDNPPRATSPWWALPTVGHSLEL